MAKDRDVKMMIKRVDATMKRLEEFLSKVKINAEDVAEVEKDRVSYKEGLVDGICMTSWIKEIVSGEGDNTTVDEIDYVGGGGKEKELAVVLEEIGSVFGFDGKEQLERVKMVEEVDSANVEAIGQETRDDEEVLDTKITDIKGKEVDDAGND